jgi:uncharacterized protein
MRAMKIQALPAAGFHRMPWKNGGGINLDIASEGATEGWIRFDWRFGRTTIATPGPFSDFSGYERVQVAIAGSGLILETPDGAIDLRKPFHPVRYDGALPIVTRLEAGPVEVVNLIADKARFTIDLRVPVAGAPLRCGPGIHILYAPFKAVRARIGTEDLSLPAGDACEIRAAEACELVLNAGVLILASISERPGQS